MRYSMVDSASVYNAAVEITNIGDSLHKLVNTQYISYLRNMSLSEFQILGLREIAALCPFEFGDGVYIARGLLARADTLLYRYANNCEYGITPSNKSVQTNSNVLEKDYLVSVYPNPASQQMNISVTGEENGLALFSLYDLIGTKVLDHPVTFNEEIKLDVSSLSQGVYFYSLRYLDVVKTDKIVIIK